MTFKFKQFEVKQEKSAMKIGTDAVILGGYTKTTTDTFSILDIGTGTGVIALMLAQKSNAEIVDAIEIEEGAYEECVENFENSAWGDRLFCYHASIQEFASEIEDKYDLIVSNPPFFEEDYKTPVENRNTARFTDALPYEHLIICVAELLEPKGTFNVIIPFEKKEKFVELAKKQNLYLRETLDIKGNINSPLKRSILSFQFNEIDSSPTKNRLVIEIDRHVYTEDYIALTKDFYLKM
jgi:tRNA1Val (adenine37-N6)-methyltransferase